MNSKLTADVSKHKCQFANDMCDLYNQEMFFLGDCSRFPSKFSRDIELMDLSLRIYFDSNNVIHINCVDYIYYNGDPKRKIILTKLQSDIVNYHTCDDNSWYS